MLSRILEPEVMDTEQEARDYDSMDHSEVNRVFVDDLLSASRHAGIPLQLEVSGGLGEMLGKRAVAQQGPATKVLDLGTGTALIPIELCRRAVAVQIVAIDLAEEMLKLAEVNVGRAAMWHSIWLERVDGKRLPYADSTFDAVISNSIVHHIPEPRSVLAEALRVVRPGGLIFIRDLLRPADDATVRHLVDTYAAGANDHQRFLLDASLRAALSLAEIRDLVASLGFSPDMVKATSDRHWTWSVRR